MPKGMLAVMCLYVELMRGRPSVCSGEVASPCDLGMAEVVLFPQMLPFPPPGGQSLAPACPGLTSGPWQAGIALGFLAEMVGLMFHFYIVAGARLGEMPPTQAGASTSCGEEGWPHVLLSCPRAGAASPGLLGVLQLLWCSGPVSSGHFGISSIQWILELEQGRDCYPPPSPAWT